MLDAALPALTALVGVGALASAQGGFFPSSWGLAALGFAWLVTVVLILRPTVRLALLDLVVLFALLAFTGWIALSVFWSENAPSTVQEVQRALARSPDLYGPDRTPPEGGAKALGFWGLARHASDGSAVSGCSA